MGSFRRYRDLVLVILLLAVPFFFLRASIRKPEDMNAIDHAIMRAEGYDEPLFGRPAPPFVRPAKPEDVIDDKEDGDAP